MNAALLLLPLVWLPGVAEVPANPSPEMPKASVPLAEPPPLPMAYRSAPGLSFGPSSLLWPFPFGVRLGWATASAPNPDPEDSPARVFLLRGRGCVLSPGFGDLCTQLRQAGVWTEDLRCVGDLWVYNYLLAEHYAGKRCGPIVLVGHSCGGRHVLYLSRRLQSAGIPVDLVLCLDVALLPKVPGNVHQAVNLYLSHHLYPSGILAPACGSMACVENLDLNSPDSPVNTHGLWHANVSADPIVQAIMLNCILDVVYPASGEVASP